MLFYSIVWQHYMKVKQLFPSDTSFEHLWNKRSFLGRRRGSTMHNILDDIKNFLLRILMSWHRGEIFDAVCICLQAIKDLFMFFIFTIKGWAVRRNNCLEGLLLLWWLRDMFLVCSFKEFSCRLGRRRRLRGIIWSWSRRRLRCMIFGRRRRWVFFWRRWLVFFLRRRRRSLCRQNRCYDC